MLSTNQQGSQTQIVADASTSNAVVADTFSWAVFDLKMNNLLDAKLYDVVKKTERCSN